MVDVAVVMRTVDHYGGAERFLLECLARWQHRHDLTLYATAWSDPLLEEHGIDLDRVRRVPLHSLSIDLKDSPLNGLLLPKIWEQEIGEHEVYHFHQWPTHLIDRHPSVWYPHEPRRVLHDMRYESAVTSAAESLQAGLAQRTRIADLTRLAALTALKQLDLLGKPDRIVANSHYTARYLERVYGQPVTDIVYPGVNMDDFAGTAPPEDFLLAVSRYTAAKRCRLFLEAVARVEAVRLVMVGEDLTGVRAELQRMAEHLGIADRVSLLKGVSQSELRSLYARCRGVLFAPIREPFGIVALEALAAGKPLIAVPEGGYAEIVDDTCALLVPPRPDAIASAIRRLLDHPEQARALGKAGREVAQQYTWDRTADELSAILEATCREERSKSNARVFPIAAGAGPHPGTLCGIHYYCWYGDGRGAAHWSGADQPALGHYPSSAGWVIEEHLRRLTDVGFDFLIINLHPDDAGTVCRELIIADRIDALAERLDSPLRFTVRLDMTQATATTDHVARLVRTDLARRPRFLKLSDRPVLFAQGDSEIGDAVHRLADDFTVIATTIVLPAGQGGAPALNGWCADGPLVFDAERVAPALAHSSPGHPRVLTVSPGYDAMDGTVVVPRKDGITYRRMIDFVLGAAPRPDLLVVSSFNDYVRNTHIEESEANGTRYLDLTRELIRSLKDGSAVAPRVAHGRAA